MPDTRKILMTLKYQNDGFCELTATIDDGEEVPVIRMDENSHLIDQWERFSGVILAYMEKCLKEAFVAMTPKKE